MWSFEDCKDRKIPAESPRDWAVTRKRGRKLESAGGSESPGPCREQPAWRGAAGPTLRFVPTSLIPSRCTCPSAIADVRLRRWWSVGEEVAMCKHHSHGPHQPQAQNWHNIHKDQSKMQAAFPLVEDYSSCDIVKATQYGILERCKELVEAGYDVRQPDKENVTLLHWAAINNRLDLVKFYISKGAVVDQLGGDLNSTPLHWAIRQGHLSMVILLLKCGGDPTLIDGEGYSSIHLAVVFQHMPIIAYLISKGQSIDTTDFSGQTPLMLSAQKVIGPEPTGFLLKFNPSLSAVDKIQKNTALHWAVTAGNVNAVELLLDAGSNLDIKNVKGDTPLDLAHQIQNRLIIHMLTQEEKMRIRKNSRLLRMLAKYEVFSFI
ncbi:NEDD4 family-interacting protein 1 [Platysternon megacephalum]|uniref:protein S-acyltransferase n=1 Tax=Platysternon megacephalum TaxID=55544 RepID=A0A4D9ELR2_9SAUR|nr:NEDD4 family-interacting protein 1 [Platysternon megacephalum]